MSAPHNSTIRLTRFFDDALKEFFTGGLLLETAAGVITVIQKSKVHQKYAFKGRIYMHWLFFFFFPSCSQIGYLNRQLAAQVGIRQIICSSIIMLLRQCISNLSAINHQPPTGVSYPTLTSSDHNRATVWDRLLTRESDVIDSSWCRRPRRADRIIKADLLGSDSARIMSYRMSELRLM